MELPNSLLVIMFFLQRWLPPVCPPSPFNPAPGSLQAQLFGSTSAMEVSGTQVDHEGEKRVPFKKMDRLFTQIFRVLGDLQLMTFKRILELWTST